MLADEEGGGGGRCVSWKVLRSSEVAGGGGVRLLCGVVSPLDFAISTPLKELSVWCFIIWK